MQQIQFEVKADIIDRYGNNFRVFLLPEGYSFAVELQIEDAFSGEVSAVVLHPNDVETLLNVCLDILTDGGV